MGRRGRAPVTSWVSLLRYMKPSMSQVWEDNVKIHSTVHSAFPEESGKIAHSQIEW